MDGLGHFTHEARGCGVLLVCGRVLSLKLRQKGSLPCSILRAIFALLELDPPHQCLAIITIDNGMILVAKGVRLSGHGHESRAELIEP